MRIVVTGLLYLVIFASGVWWTKSGKPYSAIILTVHKLIVDKNGKGTGQFAAHKLLGSPAQQGHGLGAGDVAGNGRVDIVLNRGRTAAEQQPSADST